MGLDMLLEVMVMVVVGVVMRGVELLYVPNDE